jgi:hypothetical protein
MYRAWRLLSGEAYTKMYNTSKITVKRGDSVVNNSALLYVVVMASTDDGHND